MATEIFLNIKDLPEITEPKNGDFILVETSTGTHIIDFKNFIVPTTNTVITTTVEQNTTAILTNTTNIATISSSVTNLSSAMGTPLYLGKAQITIAAGNNQANGTVYPAPTTTLISGDIIITPGNAYACTYPVYVSNIDNAGIVTLKAALTSSAVESGVYNIMALRTKS